MPNDIGIILKDSLRSGWLTTGPKVKIFEKNLEQYLEAKHVVALNSCTAALHLSLAAKEYEPDTKVIVPTYTFVSTVEIIEYLGFQPVLIDCDENFNIDLNQVIAKLKSEKNIRAIIPVHFGGHAVDMKILTKLAEEHNLFIIEDCAHALESKSNLGKVGNTNDVAAFSFYANKNITSGGEGGAISTNDNHLADKIRKLSLHGLSKDGWNRFKIGNKWEYDVSMLGYKYNMTDVSASIGDWQLSQIDNWHKIRTDIVKKYHSDLKDIKGLLLPKINRDSQNDSFHLFIVRLVPELWKINRNRLIEELNKLNIGTSVHYKPVHMHSYYKKKYDYESNDFPKASGFFQNVISLPIYPALSITQQEYIIDKLNILWHKYKI